MYKLLSDKLGDDTTEAMFKYIDNKTERSVESTIKTLATKDDIAILRKEMGENTANLRKEMADGNIKLHKDMAESRTENTKWMFIFWIGQVGATLAILLLFLKK